MEIQNIAITAIRPYHRNPRKNDKSIALLVKAIKKQGFTEPITVDEDYTILTGHSRYFAARHIGMTEIPTVVLKLDAKKAAEFRLADNAAADHTFFDADALANTLAQDDYIKDIDFQEFFRAKNYIEPIAFEEAPKPKFAREEEQIGITNKHHQQHGEAPILANQNVVVQPKQEYPNSGLLANEESATSDYKSNSYGIPEDEELLDYEQEELEADDEYGCMCPNCLHEFGIDNLLIK
jgi:hypothetical protein